MERKSSVWRSQRLKQLFVGLAACATYVLAAKLSLRLATVHPSASPFWPPTGIAMVTLLLLGLRYWPAIFVGAFVVNLTTAGSVLTSLGIGAGNCLEAVTATYLVSRFANGKDVFRSEEHTSELQSHVNLVCRLLLEKKKKCTSKKQQH